MLFLLITNKCFTFSCNQYLQYFLFYYLGFFAFLIFLELNTICNELKIWQANFYLIILYERVENYKTDMASNGLGYADFFKKVRKSIKWLSPTTTSNACWMSYILTVRY